MSSKWEAGPRYRLVQEDASCEQLSTGRRLECSPLRFLLLDREILFLVIVIVDASIILICNYYFIVVFLTVYRTRYLEAPDML